MLSENLALVILRPIFIVPVLSQAWFLSIFPQTILLNQFPFEIKLIEILVLSLVTTALTKTSVWAALGALKQIQKRKQARVPTSHVLPLRIFLKR